MTSEGAMGWRARGFIALRIIRWNPRRASISDNGGWSVGGGMDVRGGGSGEKICKTPFLAHISIKIKWIR